MPVHATDSLKAIDSDRIASRIEYFSEFVDVPVVALLEEDTSAVLEQYDRIMEISGIIAGATSPLCLVHEITSRTMRMREIIALFDQDGRINY